MAATTLPVPPLGVEGGADDLKSPRTVAMMAAASVPLPLTPGRPAAEARPTAAPTPPAGPKKPAKTKKQQPARQVGATARPAPKAAAAAPSQSARAAPKQLIGHASAAWDAAKPALLRLATYAGTLIFWLCFQILSGVSRAVNAVTGQPAWNAALLAQVRAAEPVPDADTAAARAAEVTRLLRLHGDGSLSAATAVNPEFEWFIAKFDAPASGIDGALAWCDAAGYGRRVAMAVGDPLAAPADWPALAATFAAAHPGRAQFWHASAEFAAVLDGMGGFFVNDFGAETVIDLRVRFFWEGWRAWWVGGWERGLPAPALSPLFFFLRAPHFSRFPSLSLQEFAYGGRAKKLKVDIKAALARCDVREVTELNAAERAALAGLTGECCCFLVGSGEGKVGWRIFFFAHTPTHAHPPTPTHTHTHSDSWTGRKAVSDRRLRCFARALEWESVQLGAAGGHARLFVATAKQAGGGGDTTPTPITPSTLDAFVLCDPLWKGGRIVGYCPAASQARASAHHGTIKALYEAAMAAARADLAAAAAPGSPPDAPTPSTFTLGLSPVYDLSAEVFTRARLLRDAHLFLRTCGNGLYAYQAVGGAKARWGGAGKGVPGVSSPHVYIAQPTWAPWTLELLDMWVCLRFVGIGRGVNATAAKLLGWGEGGGRGGKEVGEQEEEGRGGGRSARALAA
jgi:hypothetical protein